MTRIGAIADIHVAPAGTRPQAWHGPLAFEQAEARFARAISFLEALEVDVIIVVGDVTHFGDQPSFDRAIRVLREATRPLRIVNGNHDALETSDMLASAIAELAPSSIACLTAQPESIGSLSLVGVDVRLERRAKSFARTPDVRHWGRGLVLFVSHYPVVSRSAVLVARGIRDAGNLTNGRQELERALHRRAGPTIVLCGHLHVREAYAHGAVLQVAVPALIEDSPQAAVVECSDDTVGVRFHPIDESQHNYQPSLSPASSSWQYNCTQQRWQPTHTRPFGDEGKADQPRL